MRHAALSIGCVVLAGVAAAPGAIIVWDFNPGDLKGAVGSATETIHGSATGSNPLDPSTPLVTAAGFNANGTPHNLYWKTAGTSEHGLGLTGTRGHELTLKSKGTAIANYMRIDTSALVQQDWTDLQIRVQSVQANSSKDQEQFDVWGSNSPTSMGTKLISGSAADNSFIPLPLDGGVYDNYYFVTVTPQGKGHSRDNVLLDAISASDETIRTPEPATLALLALTGLAVRGRKRR